MSVELFTNVLCHIYGGNHNCLLLTDAEWHREREPSALITKKSHNNSQLCSFIFLNSYIRINPPHDAVRWCDQEEEKQEIKQGHLEEGEHLPSEQRLWTGISFLLVFAVCITTNNFSFIDAVVLLSPCVFLLLNSLWASRFEESASEICQTLLFRSLCLLLNQHRNINQACK